MSRRNRESPPFPAEEAKRLAPLLGLTASLGGGPVIEAFMEAFGILDHLSADDRRYIHGPVVVHKGGGWHKDLPRWVATQAKAERIPIVLGARGPGWIASPTEIVAAMYDAVCDAPMRHPMPDLYVWAGAHANSAHRQISLDAFWEQFCTGSHFRPIRDEDVLAPNSHSDLARVYRELSWEIRRKVIAHSKWRARHPSERPGSNVPPPPERPDLDSIVQLPLDVFSAE